MGVFARSWEITKVTFSVMKKEKELFVFPILSIIFSLMFLVAILFPTIILAIFKGSSPAWGIYQYFLIFFVYLGLAFIATFFNTCVVYTAAIAFNNQEARFWSSIKFSLSRIHVIFLWSIISATIGLLLKIIEDIAKKAKGIGKILLVIFKSIFGMAWNIITIFVIQGLVYHNLGPFSAIKKSLEVLRKTWGESLVRVIGMGFSQFIFILMGIIIGIPLVLLSAKLAGIIGVVISISILFIYFLVIVLLFSVANQIFNTALYIYAETGIVPSFYSEENMKGVFKSEDKKLKII